MRSRRALLAILLIAGCSREHESSPPPRPVLQPAQLAAPPVHVLRVASAAGAVRSEPTLGPDESRREATRFELAEGASLSLALDDDVQISARGPAVLSVLAHGEPLLLVRRGTVALDVAARSGRRAGQALLVATPALALEVPFAARAVVHASDTHAHDLAVVSGQVLVAGERPTPAGAGYRSCTPAGPEPVSGSFAKLEEALAAVPYSQVCAALPPPELGALGHALRQRLDALEQATAKESALLAQHAATLRTPEAGARASEIRGELAQGAMQSLTLRELARALRAQLEAALLEARDPAQPAHRALADRARNLEKPAP